MNQDKANRGMDNFIEDNIDKMFLRLPVVYDWWDYNGERKFVSINREATIKAGKPMMDLHYCATKCMNGIVEKTVQYDKKKFSRPIAPNSKSGNQK